MLVTTGSYIVIKRTMANADGLISYSKAKRIHLSNPSCSAVFPPPIVYKIIFSSSNDFQNQADSKKSHFCTFKMSPASETAFIIAVVALILSTGDCLWLHPEVAPIDCTAVEYVENSTVTFYGGPDNDPAWSNATAYVCDPSHGYHAGGTGSYDDPLSFAAAVGEYKKCEIVYSPYVKKYLRKDDTCASCKAPHIDIWTGSSITQKNGVKQIKCEETMTPDEGQRVIRNPPKDLHVNSKDTHISRVRPPTGTLA